MTQKEFLIKISNGKGVVVSSFLEAVILLLTGVSIICFILRWGPVRLFENSAHNWQLTKGKIILIDVTERYFQPDQSGNMSPPMFTPRIEYEYEVNDRKYRSDRVFLYFHFMRLIRGKKLKIS